MTVKELMMVLEIMPPDAEIRLEAWSNCDQFLPIELCSARFVGDEQSLRKYADEELCRGASEESAAKAIPAPFVLLES